MAEQHFILATAGHVDHGKSSLVKALTGTDPDRLPEEKARGITIDLGFAHLSLPVPCPASNEATRPLTPSLSPNGGDGARRAGEGAASFDVGIVDVPGHEDFVKNMVAGVGSIDLALFIVAADDGWMPQTEEHLQILTYLGVSRAVVALTKIDLAQDEATSLAALRAKLAGTAFENAPIVPTSVVSGRGVEELKQTLALVLAATPPPRDIGKPRLPVDRGFTLRGIGTVVTGTLIGGSLKRGQAVVVQPSGLAAKIRSVQSHSSEVETSGPGTRTALNVPELSNRSEHNGDGIGRGDVLTLAELGKTADTLGVWLEKSARLAGGKGPATKPLKDGTTVQVHHGSNHFTARIFLLRQASPLEPGQAVPAQLRCERPVFAFAGDRFIIRDWSEQATLGGGIIVDPAADRKRARGEAREKFLEARAQSPAEASVYIATQLERDGAARRVGLLVQSRFSAPEITEAIARMALAKQVITIGDWVMEAGWWQGLRLRAAELIAATHRTHPDRPGMALNELRSGLTKSLPAPELFEPLLAELSRNGFVQTGSAIRSVTHKLALPPQLQAAGVRVRAGLSAKPLEPPSRKELAPDVLTQQALRFLLNSGEALDLGEEVVLLKEHFERAREVVVKFIRERGPATTSDLRQMLGTSRRILIPLLERLDRDGVTRREGDRRVLKK